MGKILQICFYFDIRAKKVSNVLPTFQKSQFICSLISKFNFVFQNSQSTNLSQNDLLLKTQLLMNFSNNTDRSPGSTFIHVEFMQKYGKYFKNTFLGNLRLFSNRN